MSRRSRATTKPDLADAAYTRLAHAIATGEIAAGAALNERDVSLRLGMSRTPLRAALHRLALEGLVVAVPKKGTYAAPLDARDIEDNMAVREALEIEMAQQVIDAGAEVDPAPLHELLEAQQHAIDHLDSPAFLRADEQFHLHILAASGNRRALEVAQHAWLHINRARYLVPMTVATMREALQSHRAIAAALLDRDSTRLQRAIRDHTDAPLIRQLRSNDAEPDAGNAQRRAAQLQSALRQEPLTRTPTQ